MFKPCGILPTSGCFSGHRHCHGLPHPQSWCDPPVLRHRTPTAAGGTRCCSSTSSASSGQRTSAPTPPWTPSKRRSVRRPCKIVDAACSGWVGSPISGFSQQNTCFLHGIVECTECHMVNFLRPGPPQKKASNPNSIFFMVFVLPPPLPPAFFVCLVPPLSPMDGHIFWMSLQPKPLPQAAQRQAHLCGPGGVRAHQEIRMEFTPSTSGEWF